ncbi:hypothetical protein WG08_18320, partial [Vibrio cholerae]
IEPRWLQLLCLSFVLCVASPLGGRMLNPLKSSVCGFRFLWHFVHVLSAIQYCLSLPNEAAMYLAL